jgi:SAM-dependent methyltransferase
MLERPGSMNERTVKKLLDLPPGFLKESFKRAMVGACVKLKAGRTFSFQGREYHYLYHPYNLTWRNERSVEVPIALEQLGSHEGQPVLEVGNVLSHYVEAGHEVLDKYEAAPGVINADAVDFDPGKLYGLIICISTLEHIGQDEDKRERDKPLHAIENLARLLAPGGRMVATVPVGVNPDLDRLLLSGDTPFGETLAMRRPGVSNTWEQVEVASVAGVGYSRMGFRAKAILIATIEKGRK